MRPPAGAAAAAGEGDEDGDEEEAAAYGGAAAAAAAAAAGPENAAAGADPGARRRRDFLSQSASSRRASSADTLASARSVNLDGLSQVLRSMEDDIVNVGRQLEGNVEEEGIIPDPSRGAAPADPAAAAAAAEFDDADTNVDISGDDDDDDDGDDGDDPGLTLGSLGAAPETARLDPMNDMPMFPAWFGRSVSDFTNGIKSPRSVASGSDSGLDDNGSESGAEPGDRGASPAPSASGSEKTMIMRTRTGIGPTVRRVYSPVNQLRKTLQKTHSTGDLSSAEEGGSEGRAQFLSFPLRRRSSAESSAADSAAATAAAPALLGSGSSERHHRRTWSTASNVVLDLFSRFEDDLNDVHSNLYIDYASSDALILVATPKLQELKEQLNELDKSLQDLATKHIAAINLAEVSSGRIELEEQRNSLLRRCREYLDRSKDMKAEVTKILRDRVDFAKEQMIRLFTATWNVGNQAPDPDELDRWVPAGGGENDVLVIGLQECEYELTQAMKKTVTSGQLRRKLTRQELDKVGAHARFGSGVLTANYKHNRLGAYTLYYRLKFENGLKKTITSNVGVHVSSIILGHIGAEWALVRESELAQMRLFVFAKKVHLHAISDVQYASEATGVGGIGANKGGVAASFTMYGMRLGWISCHLAAHKKQRYVKARNNDLAEIFMSFDKKLSSRWYNLTSVLDHMFLLGDLNYRIDLGIPGLLPSGAVQAVQRMSTDISLPSVQPAPPLARNAGREASTSTASASATASASSVDVPVLIDGEKRMSTAGALSRFSSSEALCDDDCDSDDGSTILKKDESGDLIMEVKADVNAAEAGDRPQVQTSPTRHTDSTLHEWNKVAELVYKRDWAKLAAADQLRAEMKARRALTSFQEGECNFAPTFKVVRNKPFPAYVFQRCPSYCDRILWHSLPGMRERIKQLRLEACHTVTTSDHKPVVAEFVMKIRDPYPGDSLPELEAVSEQVIESYAPALRDHLDDLHKGGGFRLTSSQVFSEQATQDQADTDQNGNAQQHSPLAERRRQQRKHAGLQEKHHRRISSTGDGKKIAMDAGLWGSGGMSKKAMRPYSVSEVDEPIPLGGMRIRIRSLKVENLTSRDYDGQASPFIVFCSPNLFTPRQSGYNPKRGAAHTSVLRHRLSAEWQDEQVPDIPLPLNFSKASQTRRCHLVFAIWDVDSVAREHSLGQANLGLGPVADEYERLAGASSDENDYRRSASLPINFRTPILMYGRQAGVVSGSIQLLGPDYDDKIHSSRTAPVAKPHKPRTPAACCSMQ